MTQRLVAAASVLTLVGVAFYAFQDVLHPGVDRLPGNDAVNLYFWEFYTRKVLAAGALPFWNPYHMTGAPHLADTQTTVLYPPALLLRGLSPMAFLPWMAVVHIGIAGGGGLFLARVLGLGWLPSLAAAMATMLGGSVGPWLHNGHLLVLYGTSWLPWALGLAILSVRRGSVLPHPALVVVMVVQFLAGYLQGSLYIGAAVAAYFIYSSVVARRTDRVHFSNPLWQLAILVACAIGLSAFQLFPLLQLTQAAGRTAGLPYSVASQGGVHLADLARLLFPFRGVVAEPAYRFLPDAATYVGALVAMMVPFAVLDRRRRHDSLFLGILAVVAILFASAADVPLYRLHFLLVPGLRIPGRLLFLATVALAALGAVGLEAFINACGAREWRRLAAPACASAVLIGGSIALTVPTSTTLPLSHLGTVATIVIALVAVPVGMIAAFGSRRVAAVVAVGVIGFDLVAFAKPSAHSVPIETAETMRRVMGPADDGRAVSVCENRIGAGEFLVNGQATLDGLAAMHLSHYADWASLAKSAEPPPHDGLYRRIGSEGLLPARFDLLNMANVSLIYSCEPLDAPGLTLVSHIGPIYRYRNERVWPRAFWTCDVQETTATDATTWLLNGRYDDRRRLVARPSINVRWVAGVSDEQRREVELRRHLVDGVKRDDATWRYALSDASVDNGLALLREPAVEDTAGIDRRTGELPTSAVAPLRTVPGGGDWVIGGRDCATSATVRVLSADRPDGVVDVEVEATTPGFIFLSEAYYPERRAAVDGNPTPVLRTNLAFSAIPVGAGRHRVELRFEPRSFQLGLAASVVTLAAWVSLLRLTRRRTTSKESASAA